MNIFNFSKETGEYLSTSAAQVDPLETEKNQRDAYVAAYDAAIAAEKSEAEADADGQAAAAAADTAYLIPAYATDIEPPAPGADEIAVFDGSAWALQADFRETAYCDQDGNETKIENIGETVPADCLTDPAPSVYHTTHDGSAWIWDEDAHKAARLQEVEQEFLNRLDAPFPYDSKNWQVDKKSQDSIAKRSIYAKVSNDDPTNYPWISELQTWRDADNVDQTFATPADYMNLGKAVTEHVATLFISMQNHKDAVRALTTYEDVAAYDVSINW